MDANICAGDKHTGLYEEVQESFVANLVRARRVAGGIDPETGEVLQMQKSGLAEESGLSKGTMTKLTSMEPQEARPDLETLCKLGHALNVSPAFLLMTPRDWSILMQSFSTLHSIRNPEGEHEKELARILEDAAKGQIVSETVKGGLDFMEELLGENYSDPERERLQRGILAMTAMAQGALKRQGIPQKMYATALAAILGGREVSHS